MCVSPGKLDGTLVVTSIVALNVTLSKTVTIWRRPDFVATQYSVVLSSSIRGTNVSLLVTFCVSRYPDGSVSYLWRTIGNESDVDHFD